MNCSLLITWQDVPFSQPIHGRMHEQVDCYSANQGPGAFRVAPLSIQAFSGLKVPGLLSKGGHSRQRSQLFQNKAVFFSFLQLLIAFVVDDRADKVNQTLASAKFLYMMSLVLNNRKFLSQLLDFILFTLRV